MDESYILYHGIYTQTSQYPLRITFVVARQDNQTFIERNLAT